MTPLLHAKNVHPIMIYIIWNYVLNVKHLTKEFSTLLAYNVCPKKDEKKFWELLDSEGK